MALGTRSPKSTMLWLDRQRADPLLPPQGTNGGLLTREPSPPSHLTHHLQHIPQGQSVYVIIIVYSRVHNPVTHQFGSVECSVLVCTVVVSFNKPICNTFGQ